MEGEIKHLEREIIEAIVAQLDQENDRTRWCAVKALGRLGARQAMPALIAALGCDPDPDVRMEIAAVLGAHGEVGAVEALISSLHDDFDDDVRLQACQALGQIRDSRAEEALIGCLAVHDGIDLADWDMGDDVGFSVAWELQREALEGLARIGGDRAIKAIIGLLQADDDGGLQSLGLRVLGALGGQRAVSYVIEELRDGHQTARQQAAKALAQVQDERVIPPLLIALEDREAEVRIAASWSLCAKQDPATFPVLLQLLQDPEAFVRREAVMMAAGLSDADVVTPLIRLAYDSDHTVRQRAIQTLGERRESRASANLLAMLNRSPNDEMLAIDLIKALGLIKADDALDPLGQFLKSGCLATTVRMQAVLALGEIAAEASGQAEIDPIEILTCLIDDEALQVGQAALLALSRIGGERAHAAIVNALRADISKPDADNGGGKTESPFPTSTLAAIQAATPADAKPEHKQLQRRGQIRSSAARLISGCHLPQAHELLCQAARDDNPELRCEALSALGRVGGDDVLTVIAEGIGDTSREVRLAALSALGQIQPDCVMVMLLERLAVESDSLVKQKILEMAGRLGDERATADILLLLDDDERHVQGAALEALASLQARSSITAVRPFLFAYGGALWREALTALRHLQDREIAAYLLETLKKPEQEELHWIAVEALAELSG